MICTKYCMHSLFLLGWPKSSFGFFFFFFNIQSLLVKSYTGKNNYPRLGSHPLCLFVVLDPQRRFASYQLYLRIFQDPVIILSQKDLKELFRLSDAKEKDMSEILS